MSGNSGTTLKTAHRTLDVLEIVAESVAPLTVREVADRLEHNLSSTYHIVNTLLARDYLAREAGGELVIGSRARPLYVAYNRRGGVARQIRPLIERLAASSGETVYLTRYMLGSVVIEQVIESQQSLRATGLEVGYSGAEIVRASGKAVLAYVTSDELDEHWKRLRTTVAEHGITRQDLDGALERIREQGYAFDDEEYEAGICCVAIPYFDGDGRVAGSVAVSAPALRAESLIGSVRGEATQVAMQISGLLAN